MSKYRYLFADLLTRQVNFEMSLFGVTYGKRLNKPGNFTGSTQLGTSAFNDSDLVGATIPGRTAVFIERNGSLSWGGILWSRTYESQGKTLQFTGQTFESYFYKQFLQHDFKKTNMDQLEILRQLIIDMSSKPYADIGIQVPASALSGGIVRSPNFYAYEGWSYGTIIENLIGYADGFDYTLDVAYDGNNNPTIRLNTANTLGIPLNQSQLAFDYPGNIANYWYPESASDAGTTVLGFGAGEGSSMARTEYIEQDLLDAGFPDLQTSYNNKDVSSISTLASQTKAAADLARVPIIVPTFAVNPNLDPQMDTYSLGDWCTTTIVDPRFPDGKQVSSRIIGWDVTPQSSDSDDSMQLVIAGQEDQ